MSNLSDRVEFYLPEGTEDVNVTTDLNGNLQKIDTNLNFRVVANTTARLAVDPIWEGLNVRETDTGDCYVSNGTAPASASWTQLITADTSGDALLQVGIPTIVYLTSDSLRTSTTSFTDDSVLTANLTANSVYLIELMLIMTGDVAGDMKSIYTVPSGATGMRSVAFYGDTDVGVAASYATEFQYTAQGSTPSVAWENTVITTTTGGTFALSWAQLTSNATPTRLNAGSWLRLTKIS